VYSLVPKCIIIAIGFVAGYEAFVGDGGRAVYIPAYNREAICPSGKTERPQWRYHLLGLVVQTDVTLYTPDEPIEDILRKDGHRVQEKIDKGLHLNTCTS
jgi:hypothetical protein